MKEVVKLLFGPARHHMFSFFKGPLCNCSITPPADLLLYLFMFSLILLSCVFLLNIASNRLSQGITVCDANVRCASK